MLYKSKYLLVLEEIETKVYKHASIEEQWIVRGNYRFQWVQCLVCLETLVSPSPKFLQSTYSTILPSKNQCFSKCDTWITNMGFTWELVRNAESQELSQTFWTYNLTSSLDGLFYINWSPNNWDLSLYCLLKEIFSDIPDWIQCLFKSSIALSSSHAWFLHQNFIFISLSLD